jgi:hypothetical protein
MKESEDIKRAGEGVDTVRAQIKELDQQILADTQRIASRFEGDAPLERISLTPKRGQVAVHFVALGWIPAGEGARV